MHFTYKEPNKNKLKQGDILKKTPELLALIQEIHPDYASEDYLFFQVLTQSCDLVRRKNGCKSRYITIAAVRSLDLIVRRAIESFTNQTIFKNKVFCSEVHKKSLKEVFNKLLNNNDTNHFFLESSPDHELTQRCCTQLHLSISIRANEHFDTCLNAKRLELSESFQAKLGWLVGNLYSRVATEDYVPGAIPDETAYESYRNELIDGYVAWVRETDFPQFKKLAVGADNIDALRENIANEHLRSRESRLNGIVSAIAKPLELDQEKIDIVKNILNQHPLLQKLLK